MPRPKRKRKIFSLPLAEGFKPFGLPFNKTEAVELLFEEYEAIKLSDYQGLTQEEAAKKMNVSRPTFTRIYEKARKTIASALVEGKILIITGGHIDIDDEYTNHLQEKIKYEVGKDGFCICLKCEIRIKHTPGEPCREKKCPECGEKMYRENSYIHIKEREKGKE